MANINEVHESCLLDEKRKRRKLIEDIRQVAVDIQFEGRGDTPVLAQELDRREIEPLWIGKWYQINSYSDSTTQLREFMKRHLPDLWPHGAKPTDESGPSGCLCSKCDAARENGCKLTHSPDAPLDNQAVSKKPVSKDRLVRQQQAVGLAHNIDGWTVRQDKKGFFRAYRRINGKVKSIYLGKSLDGAQDKIAGAIADYMRSEWALTSHGLK